jgi:non-specific serine/threonine protein kinase/serine/threonine-protein kinase
MLRSKLGPDHPVTFMGRSNLVRAYETLGRWADAEPLRREVLAYSRKGSRPEDTKIAPELAGLGRNLLRQSRWSEAEPVLREALDGFTRAAADDWPRFFTMGLLGRALLGEGRCDEAEPLIVKGYEGMRDRARQIPGESASHLAEAAGRVVELYESWGKPAQAASWKAKLGLADLPADPFVPSH